MRRKILLLLLSLVFVTTGYAQSVSIRIGTLGPGLHFSIPVSSSLSLRAGGSYFAYSHSAAIEDEDVNVGFQGDLDWGGATLLADWYPFRSGFRLTGGAFYNLIKVTGTGVPTEPYYLNEGQSNEKIFQPERLGSLSAKLTYGSKINPYAGIGFGDGARGARLSFLFELGAIYVGSPEIEMQGTGMIAGSASQDEVLTEGLESFQWLPVVSVGLAIRIGKASERR